MSQVVFNFPLPRARLPALSSAFGCIFRGNSSLRFKDKYFTFVYILKKPSSLGCKICSACQLAGSSVPSNPTTFLFGKHLLSGSRDAPEDQLGAVQAWGTELESARQRQTVWRMACRPNSRANVRGSQANSPARLTESETPKKEFTSGQN